MTSEINDRVEVVPVCGRTNETDDNIALVIISDLNILMIEMNDYVEVRCD